nr:immunoglobulin light chain junction region [Macaca mulatta]
DYYCQMWDISSYHALF